MGALNSEPKEAVELGWAAMRLFKSKLNDSRRVLLYMVAALVVL